MPTFAAVGSQTPMPRLRETASIQSLKPRPGFGMPAHPREVVDRKGRFSADLASAKQRPLYRCAAGLRLRAQRLSRKPGSTPGVCRDWALPITHFYCADDLLRRSHRPPESRRHHDSLGPPGTNASPVFAVGLAGSSAAMRHHRVHVPSGVNSTLSKPSAVVHAECYRCRRLTVRQRPDVPQWSGAVNWSLITRGSRSDDRHKRRRSFTVRNVCKGATAGLHDDAATLWASASSSVARESVTQLKPFSVPSRTIAGSARAVGCAELRRP